MPERRAKKSETIEVRLNHERKQAFMTKAAGEGRSASDVVRQSIDQYLKDEKVGRGWARLPWKPAAVVGSAVMALALTQTSFLPARPAANFHSWFELLDKNGNGFVEASESARAATFVLISNASDNEPTQLQLVPLANSLSAPGIVGEFREADTNGDAALSYDEFAEYQQTLRRRRFAVADTNSDGRITLSEYARMPGAPIGEIREELFETHDADGDGWVSAAEYQA